MIPSTLAMLIERRCGKPTRRNYLWSSLPRERRSIQYRGWTIRDFSLAPFPTVYVGGCRSAVTLALLIACPTKVYHYYCHPLFLTNAAPNPLVPSLFLLSCQRLITLAFSTTSLTYLPTCSISLPWLFLSRLLSLLTHSVCAFQC